MAASLRFGDHLPGTLYYQDRQWHNVLNVLDVEFKEDSFLNIDYFAPELPAGAPEANWLRTVPGKGWFTLFRLYSPTGPFFDQSWRPGDFEKIG